MTDKEKIDILRAALEAARDHLEFISYGDSWERECAEASELPTQIEKALKETKES